MNIRLAKVKMASIVLLVSLLCSPIFVGVQVHAQTEPTLAESINNVLNNIDTSNLSPQWGSIYSQIFGLSNQTIFDSLIQEANNQSNWQEAVWVARLAELNGYNSPILTGCLTTALENMPMCGSLPITTTDTNAIEHSFPADSFCLYDRFLVNAYRYAQELGIPGWNLTQAFSDFVKAYMSPPQGAVYRSSKYGEMLWINPAANFSASYSSRYYDEFAETLDMFLEFALNGETSNITVDGLSLNATSFMDNMWNATQCLWNGKYYNYNIGSGPVVECEMGNFEQIIAEYQNYRGALPYFNNVVSELENTLLTSGASDIWVAPGVIQHMIGEPQERLGESLASVLALQTSYPYFPSNMQQNFDTMLQNGMWQNLLQSSLFSNNRFTFFADINYSSPTGNQLIPEAYTDDASMVGAMLLFLEGIIPQTGSLAITPSNENYQDYQTCFQTSQWQFNYTGQSIRIPVTAGNLGFIFGSQEVTQNFPTNGVYDIQFAPDWNSIASVTKVADIALPQLKPAILQTQLRPISTPAALTQSPQPTATPSPTPTLTSTPTRGSFSIPNELSYIAVGLGSTLFILIASTIYLKKKKPNQQPPKSLNVFKQFKGKSYLQNLLCRRVNSKKRSHV